LKAKLLANFINKF